MEVATQLPGIQYLTVINLEGRRTKEAERLLLTTATDLAKAGHGVIVDQQTDTIRTPAGVMRYVRPSKQESFEVVSFSWWFLDSPLLTRPGREAFLRLLERMLPEGMPARYGLYEPPQYRYAETGKEHLLNFLEANLHAPMVYYPRRPVSSLHLGFPNSPGSHKLGFRANHITIGVEKEALTQPGWPEGLRVFWREASRLISPFYGDVRNLGGFVRHGGTIYVSKNSESSRPGRPPSSHPVKSWWWRGIPDNIGIAGVLGEPYLKLWPAFVAAATVLDSLAFISAPDWLGNEEASAKLGGVPDFLRQPPPLDPSQHETRHAPLWPFQE